MAITIEERLQLVEDQLAIYQIVLGYSYAVDGCNADAVGDFFADGAVYAIGDHIKFEGRSQIAGITANEGHLALVGAGCGHVTSTPYVVIEGDFAVASCHMMLVEKVDENGFHVGRLSACRLQLSRKPEGGWQIDHRQHYLQSPDGKGSALLSRLREV